MVVVGESLAPVALSVGRGFVRGGETYGPTRGSEVP
jgi:hypothetical protein